MLVDVVFTNAKVFNVEHFLVVKGEKFSLLTDATNPIRWFADNDNVLSLDVTGDNGKNADLSADTIGNSTILIYDAAVPPTAPIKTLYIEVVSTTQQAANLNTTSGTPVLKS